MIGFLSDALVKRPSDAPRSLLVIIDQVLQSVPTLVSQLFRGAGFRIVLDGIPDVARHLDGKTAIDRHQWQLELGVDGLADASEEGDRSERLSDV